MRKLTLLFIAAELEAVLQNQGFLEGTHFSFFRIPDGIARIKRYLESMIFAVELRGGNYRAQGWGGRQSI